LLVAQDRDRVAGAVYSVELDLRAADHEVGVDAGDVRRAVRQLDAGVAREAEPAAVRDVAGGILVEERVEEGHARLADARRSVDERNLAEPARAVIAVELRLDDVFTALRLRVDDAAALERQLQSFDDDAAGRDEPPRR